MLRNYNYILTIMLYPFILILAFLIFNKNLNSNIYLYIFFTMIIVFIPSFIMSLYSASEEILCSNKKWHIILLVLFSFFYLPIYYTKYVSKDEKYLGFIICVLIIVFTYFSYNAFIKRFSNWLNEAYEGSVIINDNYVYAPVDKLFSINVSKDFRCNNHDIGDYVISCDKEDDDSFIGIYRYDVIDFEEEEILDILNFHLNQSLEYIKERGYKEEINKLNDIIEINYNDMVILLTQRNYVIENDKYSLIIIKEMPNKLENIDDFQKMIETIYFLNYNEEESS